MNCTREISKFFQGMSQEQWSWTLDDNPFTTFTGSESFPAVHPVDESSTSIVPLVTGSRAEFYVLPMLSCMGDVDVMFHYANELALPAGYPQPTYLPLEFDTNVNVYEIIDSPFPGYVYLHLLYLLIKCSTDGKYRVRKYAREQHPLNHGSYACGINVHGPARVYNEDMLYFLSGLNMYVDSVKCMHCLSWPPQTTDWPTRHRKWGWPSPATINSVISKGCDVVPIAHRLCREDEWASKHQWRLSFSRAEVVLLNSWTAEQQIVYHMLRIFAKNEQLVDSGEKVLSNYHLKTLMLWACEKKPQSWWTDTTGLVSVCVQLLKCLGSWLADARCQHYFVSSCNLFGYLSGSVQLHTLSGIVQSTTDEGLSRWFVENYVRKCAELCPDNIFMNLNFDQLETSEQLEIALFALNRWKEIFMLRECVRHWESLLLIFYAFLDVSSECFMHMVSDLQQHYFGKFLRAVSNKKLTSTGVSIMICMFIFTTNRMAPHSQLGDAFIDFIACSAARNVLRDISHIKEEKCFFCTHSPPAQLSKFHSNFMHPFFSKKTSAESLRKAVALMKAVSYEPYCPQQLHLIELAKSYLYIVLKSNDSTSESLFCLANVYMALLYYLTGHYQRALNHCLLTTIARKHSQCNSKAIQREVLPKTGDNLDHALGLAVLYRYIRKSALTRQSESFQTGVFTTELFAYYFIIKHILVAKCCITPKSLADSAALSTDVRLCKELEAYRQRILQKDRLFVCDLLLLMLPDDNGRCFASCDIEPSKSLSLTKLSELMRKNSIERLMSLRCRHRKKFSSVISFEALYLYRCSLYEQCIQKCQKTVSEEIEAADNNTSQLLSLMYSDFIELMDTDVVSVLGLLILVKPAIRQALSTVRIGQLCLSLYLMALSQLQLRQPVSSLHFTLDLIAVTYEAAKLCPDRLLDRAMLQVCKGKLVQRMTQTRPTEEAEKSGTEFNQRRPHQCTYRFRRTRQRASPPQMPLMHQLVDDFRALCGHMQGCSNF